MIPPIIGIVGDVIVVGMALAVTVVAEGDVTSWSCGAGIRGDANALALLEAALAYSSDREARSWGLGDGFESCGSANASREPPQSGSWKRAMLDDSSTASVLFTTPWPGMFVPVINSNWPEGLDNDSLGSGKEGSFASDIAAAGEGARAVGSKAEEPAALGAAGGTVLAGDCVGVGVCLATVGCCDADSCTGRHSCSLAKRPLRLSCFPVICRAADCRSGGGGEVAAPCFVSAGGVRAGAS